MQSPNPNPYGTQPLSPPISSPTGAPAPNPSPSMTPQEEKNWAVGIHLSSFCGYLGIPFGHILGPLVLWLMKKDGSQFLDAVGKETVNYNISLIIWAALSFAFIFSIIGLLLGFLMLGALAIMDIIVTILAAVAASNGQQYRYPLTIRFIS